MGQHDDLTSFIRSLTDDEWKFFAFVLSNRCGPVIRSTDLDEIRLERLCVSLFHTKGPRAAVRALAAVAKRFDAMALILEILSEANATPYEDIFAAGAHLMVPRDPQPVPDDLDDDGEDAS